MQFTTNYEEVLSLIERIDPIRYGKTRNYLDGAVTKLSPYISRGVISTKQIAQSVLAKGYKPYQIESFLKELAWRDYFQQVWIAKGDAINSDLKQPQPDCHNQMISQAIVMASTGIAAIDKGITELMQTGYMHNHMRMYVASLACNMGKSHWKMPAQWMYYHLLDADWASNALSWQWVAGSFSSKKYFANQENINKYCYTNQRNSFLDRSYESFDKIETPDVLKELTDFNAEIILPESAELMIDKNLPTYVYNFYNLDPEWNKHIKANRVLLLEPAFFKAYPVCSRTIQFMLDLAKNISGIRVYVGSFESAFHDMDEPSLHYKEHPLNHHYKGVQHPREWIFESVKGYYPSFFGYWKKCEKWLKHL